jgi:hypothetical protein
MAKSRAGYILIPLLAAALAFHSCGIESAPYLPPVSTGSIQTSMNNYVSIDLPSSVSSNFTSFTLYYRIYLSHEAGGSSSTGTFASVNGTLVNDYNYIAPYTNTASSNTANIASVMSNYRYYPLQYSSSSGDVLTSPGDHVVIEFPNPSVAHPYPYLSYSGGTVDLIRSNGGGVFTTVPDRYFLSTAQLRDSANILPSKNADVAGASTPGAAHAYVALYIVATGLNVPSYTPLFGHPTFVGLFMLPL